MSDLAKSVDKVLDKMTSVGGTGKGTYGEQAVLKICELIYQQKGGILYHSFSYKTDDTKAGNIKRNESGKLYLENLSASTEIDVLLVTPYRIFPIEVKAYKAKEIVLTDEGISGCYKTDKSPVHQNEFHCRHLYSGIYHVLPEGLSQYIVPIVCFVDKCRIVDKRSKWQKEYVWLTTLDTLKQFLQAHDTPMDYRLNLQSVDRVLKSIETKHEKYLPCRDLEK